MILLVKISIIIAFICVIFWLYFNKFLTYLFTNLFLKKLKKSSACNITINNSLFSWQYISKTKKKIDKKEKENDEGSHEDLKNQKIKKKLKGIFEIWGIKYHTPNINFQNKNGEIENYSVPYLCKIEYLRIYFDITSLFHVFFSEYIKKNKKFNFLINIFNYNSNINEHVLCHEIYCFGLNMWVERKGSVLSIAYMDKDEVQILGDGDTIFIDDKSELIDDDEGQNNEEEQNDDEMKLNNNEIDQNNNDTITIDNNNNNTNIEEKDKKKSNFQKISKNIFNIMSSVKKKTQTKIDKLNENIKNEGGVDEYIKVKKEKMYKDFTNMTDKIHEDGGTKIFLKEKFNKLGEDIISKTNDLKLNARKKMKQGVEEIETQILTGKWGGWNKKKKKIQEKIKNPFFLKVDRIKFKNFNIYVRGDIWSELNEYNEDNDHDLENLSSINENIKISDSNIVKKSKRIFHLAAVQFGPFPSKELIYNRMKAWEKEYKNDVNKNEKKKKRKEPYGNDPYRFDCFLNAIEFDDFKSELGLDFTHTLLKKNQKNLKASISSAIWKTLSKKMNRQEKKTSYNHDRNLSPKRMRSPLISKLKSSPKKKIIINEEVKEII